MNPTEAETASDAFPQTTPSSPRSATQRATPPFASLANMPSPVTRTSPPHRGLLAALVLAGSALLGGCVLRVPPAEFAESRSRVVLPERIALAPLDAEILTTTVRGRTVAETKWDAEITNHFTEGLAAALPLKSAKLSQLTREAARAELERVREQTRDLTARFAAFSGVRRAGTHVEVGSVNVGCIDALADALDADAVAFVQLSDRSSTDARRLAATPSTLLAIPTGVNLPPHAGITVASIAVVDRTGEVRWFNVRSTVRDLRFPEDAARLAQQLVADLDRSR